MRFSNFQPFDRRNLCQKMYFFFFFYDGAYFIAPACISAPPIRKSGCPRTGGSKGSSWNPNNLLPIYRADFYSDSTETAGLRVITSATSHPYVPRGFARTSVPKRLPFPARRRVQSSADPRREEWVKYFSRTKVERISRIFGRSARPPLFIEALNFSSKSKKEKRKEKSAKQPEISENSAGITGKPHAVRHPHT